jgi:hypothetical protein
VHPDPSHRSKFDDPRNADPREVIIAAEALICTPTIASDSA